MELQAIRYAAMVANMTFERAAQTYQEFLECDPVEVKRGMPEPTSWSFLAGPSPREEEFARDVRIILVSR